MKSKTKPNGQSYHPETTALGLGYDAFLSEGSIKPPIFMTSTFKFKNCEEGKRYFELAYGKVVREENEKDGLVYSRLNNPNLQIFEERIAVWDGAEKASVFSSGMSAIATAVLGLMEPGDHLITTLPIYGGTYFLFENILPKYGMFFHFVEAGDDAAELIEKKIQEIGADKVRLIYLETPSNPSNIMTDLKAVVEVRDRLNKKRPQDRPCYMMVDNTFLGPIYQRPSQLGVDITIYSATKFLGGHSDLIAGVVTGKTSVLAPILVTRTILGTMSGPHTGWLLLRSLETLSVRMQRQAENAVKIANVLAEHPRVSNVRYPSLLKEGTKQYDIYKGQCMGPGSLIVFDLVDEKTKNLAGEKATFKVLDSFSIYGLAVSLGGTESLVEHPMTMTHADVPESELIKIGVSNSTIRVSVGIENVEDLIDDLLYALAQK